MLNPARFPDLAGASVFVTGGATGIGAALVRGFLDQGARVAFIDLLPPAPPGPALALRGDVTDTARLRAAMDEAEAAHGPLDVLVANAAQDMRHDLAAVTQEDWDGMQAVNLRHQFFAAQRAAETMRPRGRGTIVLLTSIAYLMGVADLAVYNAAKGGVTALARSLARAWGPDGLRVNALAPGMVLTERQLRDWLTPEGIAAHLERQCLKTTIAAEDLVGPTLFLASDAARMLTGQCLMVDGGVAVTG